MKSLQQIFNTIETEQDIGVRRANKVTLYSLVNYLHAARKGISKFDMDNFLGQNSFSSVFQQLLSNSIVLENKKGDYVLNEDVKDLVLPSFQKLILQDYASNLQTRSKNPNQDLVLEFLYNNSSDISS